MMWVGWWCELVMGWIASVATICAKSPCLKERFNTRKSRAIATMGVISKQAAATSIRKKALHCVFNLV
jgi:hypothetical protein